MFKKILEILKAKDLRAKILFVLFIFAVFRLMANIPIPGIDVARIREFFGGNQFFGLMNLFTGGALDNVSIVMLGLGPYITAVIILQLLTMIFPQIEKLYKEEGEAGRQKFNQYCRIAAVPFALIQGYSMIFFLKSQGAIGSLDPIIMITAVLSIVAGSIILMWMGELISEKGIGNGVSLLIFAGIVADFPNNIQRMFITFDQTQLLSYILFGLLSLLVIAGVVLINEGRRNISVSYAKRVRGNKMYGGASTYLPLNINPAGVIPIIFAISFLMLPSMLSSFLGWTAVSDFLNNTWVYGIIYFVLVFMFTFFYTAVTFDPKSISTNLQKMGGFIPGIRPGENTAQFLQSILNKVLVIGATSLGLIAVMPLIIQGITGIQEFAFMIGGTALVIIVSVALETMRQINSQLEMREYDS
ncbi:MAG: preprotein translocase subunit SecY [Candidatus Pacebacteria bacterium]|nr:preprotein translocase subunit SecY [Candidatus Paceibacterota bacterium]MDD2757338.1 preprotein translocase subunit SecY [Candidatus Paceibacterota bacterium]MDD3283464.1 preprotein translocase subunit SecY [Candidatus Paceibacterota bacterium]MDD3969680.1 preprotein translocase subunit SecY [Candidatus Paceibacterota bacterium]MDD4737910.1 preprotein translocase subunit SecY [Candidatus Paceibacterota bacterium]